MTVHLNKLCIASFVDFFDLEAVYSSEMAGYVLLYYDYSLTLSDEVDRFWHRGPHTWASIIFFANRYIALLGHLPFVYIVYMDPCQTGNIQPILNKSHGALIFLLHILTSAILVMRVYALYFRNKWVLTLVCVEALAALGIGIWVIRRPLANTGTGLPRDRAQTASAFAGLLVLDFTVFTLSTYSTYHKYRSITPRRRRDSFARRLFVDGFVYYGVTWTVNLINVIFLLTARRPVELATPVFANVLSVVMVSRLMINLRDPMLDTSTQGETDGTNTSSREGYISTFPPDLIFATATQAEMSIELGAVDHSRGSIPHGAS